jgi:hypothetical protein
MNKDLVYHVEKELMFETVAAYAAAKQSYSNACAAINALHEVVDAIDAANIESALNLARYVLDLVAAAADSAAAATSLTESSAEMAEWVYDASVTRVAS